MIPDVIVLDTVVSGPRASRLRTTRLCNTVLRRTWATAYSIVRRANGVILARQDLYTELLKSLRLENGVDCPRSVTTPLSKV